MSDPRAHSRSQVARITDAPPNLPAGTRYRRIVGDELTVANTLGGLVARRELVGCTDPQALTDGRTYVLAVVSDSTATAVLGALPPAPSRRWSRRHSKVAATGAGVVAFLAAIGWLFVYTIASAAAWIGEHTTEVIIGIVALLIVLGASGKKCCEVIVTVTHRHR